MQTYQVGNTYMQYIMSLNQEIVLCIGGSPGDVSEEPVT